MVLATLEPEEARALAREVPGIDLVLGAFGAIQLSNVEVRGQGPENPARMIYVGNQGKKLGEVRVFLGEDGIPEKINASLVTLGKNVPDDPSLGDLLEKNRAALNEINRLKAPRTGGGKEEAPYEGASYVLSETCRKCHEEAYRVWEETKHARAFQVLVERHQDYNPACVGCHSTGFRRPTGFKNINSTPTLANVHCEACHGPGKGHPEKAGKGYGQAGTDTCRVCHTVENSPSFDPAAYRFKIRHWKTEKDPAAAGASQR